MDGWMAFPAFLSTPIVYQSQTPYMLSYFMEYEESGDDNFFILLKRIHQGVYTNFIEAFMERVMKTKVVI